MQLLRKFRRVCERVRLECSRVSLANHFYFLDLVTYLFDLFIRECDINGPNVLFEVLHFLGATTTILAPFEPAGVSTLTG
jgi:hypothetical protein